jgi:hypothetical protein
LISKSLRNKNARKKISLSRASRATRARKVFGPKLQDFAPLDNSGENHGSLSCDHARFAGERSRAMVCDQPFAVDTRLNDLRGG